MRWFSESRLELYDNALINEIVGAHARAEPLRRGLVDFVATNWFAANRPVEDRLTVRRQLQRAPGMLIGVYDGHSGDACSEFCRQQLFDYIEYYDALNRSAVSQGEDSEAAEKADFQDCVLTEEAFLNADADYLDDSS